MTDSHGPVEGCWRGVNMCILMYRARRWFRSSEVVESAVDACDLANIM